jgi:hypothetical protein
MCALKSRGMSAVCTWGLRGIFFLTLVLFELISHGASCALLCGRPLSYVCTYRTISKTPNFMLSTNCVHMRMVLMTICRARKRKKSFGTTPYRTLKK